MPQNPLVLAKDKPLGSGPKIGEQTGPKLGAPKLKQDQQEVLEQDGGVPPTTDLGKVVQPAKGFSELFGIASALVLDAMLPCVGAKVTGKLSVAIPLPLGGSLTPSLEVCIERTANGYKLNPKLALELGVDLLPTKLVELGCAVALELSPSAEAKTLGACWLMLEAVCLHELIILSKQLPAAFRGLLQAAMGGDEAYLSAMAKALEVMTPLPEFDAAKYASDEVYRAEIDAKREEVATLGMDIEMSVKGVVGLKLGSLEFGYEHTGATKRSEKYGAGPGGLEKVSSEVETEESHKVTVGLGPVTSSRLTVGDTTTLTTKVKLPSSTFIQAAAGALFTAITKEGFDGVTIKAMAMPFLLAMPSMDGSITLEATLVKVKDAPEMTFSVAGVMEAGGELAGAKLEGEQTLPIVHELKIPVVEAYMPYESYYTPETIKRKAEAERKKTYPGHPGLKFGGG